jgi:hypothetical protein
MLMTFNFKDFDDKIITGLRESGLIEKFSISEFTQTPNQEILMHFFEKPSLIHFDNGGLYFEEEGEKYYCPEMYSSISEKGEWISSKLPPITFDIDQSGNVRKSEESESMYICAQVAHILSGDEFLYEFKQVANDYNFDEMAGRSTEGNTFRTLLESWQSYQSVIINVLVSASKFKISSSKKDAEKFLKDGIGTSKEAELRDLESKIRAINFKYSQGELSPEKVKKLSKIKRLETINERDNVLTSLIVNSPVGDLYRALNLSSEYISPIKKKKIQLWIQKSVDELLQDDNFKDGNMERRSLISKFTRRAYRFEKTSIRKLTVENYINDPENFKLPSKL